MMTWRVGALGLALLTGCEPAGSTPPVDDLAASSRAAAGTKPSASVAVESKPQPEPSALGLADTAFEQFSQQLLARCEVEDEGSTVSMASAGHAMGRCLRGTVLEAAKRLPSTRRNALAVGQPSAFAKDSWSPAWLRFVDSVCAVSDAESWLGKNRRMAGSLRYVESAYCRHRPYVEAAFLVKSMQQADVAAFARHLKATELAGRQRLREVRSARENAERARAFAPEDSLVNDECWSCYLADTDWRLLAKRLHTLEVVSKTVAVAICDAWPQLARSLGTECVVAVRAHLAAYLHQVPRLDEVTAKDYTGFPPPKDTDYRRVIDPVIDGCRADEDLHYSYEPYERKHLACVKRHATKRGAPVQRWQAIQPSWLKFVNALCSVEQQVHDTGLLDAFDDRLSRLTFNVKDLQCPLITTARSIFVIHTVAQDDAKGFHRHALARARWRDAVKGGVDRISENMKAEPCNDRELPSYDDCRDPRLTASRRARLTRSIADFEREADTLGKALCREWPTLAREVPACTKAVGEYFATYPTFLGLLDRFQANERDPASP